MGDHAAFLVSCKLKTDCKLLQNCIVDRFFWRKIEIEVEWHGLFHGYYHQVVFG